MDILDKLDFNRTCNACVCARVCKVTEFIRDSRCSAVVKHLTHIVPGPSKIEGEDIASLHGAIDNKVNGDVYNFLEMYYANRCRNFIPKDST